jgi:hypothetical protein
MTKEFLETYINNNVSFNNISKETGISLTTIRYWAKKYDIKSKFSTFKDRKIDVTNLTSIVCPKCNEDKPISQYYKRKIKDRNYGFQTYCKSCFNKYTVDRWINKKINAIIYKGSKCEDCDNTYPNEPYVIFEFHHLDPSKKDFDWNTLKLHPDHIIKKELDKCDLLCSNCHKIRHYLLNKVAPTGFEPVTLSLEN